MYQLLPSLSKEEYERLKADIKRNGVKYPIEQDETGQILDGHNRLQACQELGIDCPKITVNHFESEAQKKAYVYRVNLNRRHLSPEQLSSIKTEQKILALQLKKEQKTQEEIAGLMGVAQNTISYWFGTYVDNTSNINVDNASKLDLRVKLDKKAKKAIIDRRKNGETQKEIADDLKISQQRVSQIWNEHEKKQTAIEEDNPESGGSKIITLTEWNNGKRLDETQLTKTKMNATNSNIEWAAFSWNPVTGCQHNCAYCYARDIANRFYTQKFEPAFVPERLSQPANTKPFDEPRWNGDIGYKNIFTCSMADLFGKWVPQEWIEAVLEQVKNNPQWIFLFLTKFPIRMAEFEYPKNVWLGTTVDYQWAVERAEKAFRKIKASGFEGTCWLSCEPMMERLTFTSLEMFDWVIMGGSSGNTQTLEYHPPFDDIVHLYNQAKNSNCKIYQKTNLIPGMGEDQRIRQYPQIL